VSYNFVGLDSLCSPIFIQVTVVPSCACVCVRLPFVLSWHRMPSSRAVFGTILVSCIIIVLVSFAEFEYATLFDAFIPTAPAPSTAQERPANLNSATAPAINLPPASEPKSASPSAASPSAASPVGDPVAANVPLIPVQTTSESDPGSGSRQVFVQYKFENDTRLPQTFRKCLHDNRWVQKPDLSKVPKLRIIATIDDKYLKKKKTHDEWVKTSSNMKCYCKLHNCAFETNVLDTSRYPQTKSFFGKRLFSMLDDFSDRSEFIMQIDADMIVARLDRSLDEYMTDDAEVIIQVRENMEVIAGVIYINNWKPFGRCFTQYWANQGAKYINTDNSDLLHVLLELLAPDLAEQCEKSRRVKSWATYNNKFIPCFAQLYARLHERLGDFPIKLVYPRAGLFRDRSFFNKGKALKYKWYDSSFGYRLWSTDFFLHGKTVGAEFVDADIAECDPETVKKHPKNLSPLTPEEELEVAMYCCYTHHPGCYIDDPSKTGGKINQCAESCRKRSLSENNPMKRYRYRIGSGTHECDLQSSALKQVFPKGSPMLTSSNIDEIDNAKFE
jgi:Protein of unknown function, DUF273